MILTILIILSSSATLYFPDQITQQNLYPDYRHVLTRLDCHQSYTMAKNTLLTGDYSHLDPSAPLSNKDLGILLLDHCNTKALGERDLTDAKLETAIKGL